MIGSNLLVRLKHRQGGRARLLSGWLADYANINPFNPSMCWHNERWYLAFRHFGPKRRPPFEATLFVGHRDQQQPPRSVSLTRHARSCGVPVVADPKLVTLSGGLWLTFNDGWSATENRVYLMRITPQLGRPLPCLYEGRQRVEKNWAFFTRGDDLGALYSIDPLHVLTTSGFDDSGTHLDFFDAGRAPGGTETRGLTIGTQLMESGGHHYLVAHEKWRFGRWRSYFGRWVCVHELTANPHIEVSRRRLYHSNRAMLGERPRHNPKLLSCSYFSGLSVHDDTVLLGYGVNDLRATFCEVGMDEL